MCHGLLTGAGVWSWRCDVTCFVFHIFVFNSVKMEIRGEPPGMNCGVFVTTKNFVLVFNLWFCVYELVKNRLHAVEQ